MYWTPEGERILLGAERALFEESLGMLVDELTMGDAEFGVGAFDQLQPGQKVFALYRAGRALLREDEPMPELSAFLEAAVATVYRFALDQVFQEIDDPELAAEATFSWRDLVLAVIAERSGVAEDLPGADCTDKDQWELLVDCLEDGVLWDSDFESQTGLDADPETSRLLKEVLGIAENYYTEIALDVSDEQINLYLDALRGLTPRGRG